MGFWHSFDTVLAVLHRKQAVRRRGACLKWFRISEALESGRSAAW